MHFIMFILGLLAGSVGIFLLLLEKLREVGRRQRKQHALQESLETKTRQVVNQRKDLDAEMARLKTEKDEFESRVISHRELTEENALLKRDLQNIDVDLRKLQLDREIQGRTQDTLDQRAKELGSRYLKENIKWISNSLTPNNFAASKRRLLKTIELCRGIGFTVSEKEETSLLADLKAGFEKAVRIAFEREEQARIKAQIREEQKLEREIQRELKQLEREREAIQAALEKALHESKDQHSQEIERLRARLAEAEERSQRAVSRAQMTRSGHVYVISNIGTLGEGVFKIGMTRRLEPQDRIKELSNASVPFPFDVHMMISSDDAPTLENSLHKALHKERVNKVNHRKEFFRADIEHIRKLVESNHGEVRYVATPEALEYRESLSLSDEDVAFVDSVYAEYDEDTHTVMEDG